MAWWPFGGAKDDAPFLTAQWRHLVMLNYEVDADVLTPLVPAGTALDLWQGRALVSVVGFRFLDTRVLGAAIRRHRGVRGGAPAVAHLDGNGRDADDGRGASLRPRVHTRALTGADLGPDRRRVARDCARAAPAVRSPRGSRRRRRALTRESSA